MKFSIYKIFIMSVLGTALLQACLKGEFDAPPTGGNDPQIPAEQIISLQEIMSKYYTPESIPILI
jgi:hypothetical protein